MALPALPHLLHSTKVHSAQWKRSGIDVCGDYIVVGGTAYKDSEGYKLLPGVYVYDLVTGVKLDDVDDMSGRDFNNCAIARDCGVAVSLVTGHPDIPFLMVVYPDCTSKQLNTINDQPLRDLVGFDYEDHMLVKSTRADQLLVINTKGKIVKIITMPMLTAATEQYLASQVEKEPSALTWRDTSVENARFRAPVSTQPYSPWIQSPPVQQPSPDQGDWHYAKVEEPRYHLCLNPSRTMLYIFTGTAIARKNLTDDSDFKSFAIGPFATEGPYSYHTKLVSGSWCITDSNFVFSLRKDESVRPAPYMGSDPNIRDNHENRNSQYELLLWQMDAGKIYKIMGTIKLPLGTPLAIRATTNNKLVILYHERLEIYQI